MTKRRNWHRCRLLAPLAVLGALAAGAIGCGPTQVAVCPKGDPHLVLAPSISVTDYDVSRELTPPVARELAARAARACGRVTVGILDGRPEANLELRSKRLRPERELAYNPDAVKRQLVDEAQGWVEDELLAPLEEAEPRGGSPFFQGMAKIGREVRNHGWPAATVVVVGDGLVVERSPSSGRMIRLGREDVPAQELEAFVPLLRSLEGSCVILVGAGGTSKIADRRIRESLRIMADTLDAAGVEFVASRSPEPSRRC